MDPSKIKNIFWDVDGVLADLNYAYYHFLTGHPKYRDQYQGLAWKELPDVLPILPEYGALELKTHPDMGVEMDRDFCADSKFFRNRPLYPNVIESLQELHHHGYRQFTMSATFDVEAKTAYLLDVLAPVTGFLTIECVEHGEFMHDTAKIDRLRQCYEKYDLNPEETILVDDRIYNQYAAIESGAHPVRMRCEFTTDLPSELSWIPEFQDIEAVKEWLLQACPSKPCHGHP
jgi:phosphoglycolate phosphatase-like HAD superfamily hydrolase